MNFQLNNVPLRTQKPRKNGLTMVMDKGLSVRQAEDLVAVGAAYIDFVKLGWTTAYITPKLEEKLAVYRDAGVAPYFGGTLFEAFIIRNQFDDFLRLLEKYQLGYAEISDGSITMPHEEKCEYIAKVAQHATVISEIGSKDNTKIMAPYKWISLMKAELEAGTWRLIAESRESGNVGLYRESGEVRQGLVDEILNEIPNEKIIWEAPLKSQQVYFIHLLGPNVNLGNISTNEIIALETTRLGLRGDTFHNFI
ncbi:phosphosulfolactate synthase [Parapedobacter sp. ISTM3]|uniref:Phosphosulfolactate synthase n=1 Tax=Parapedobacter luteus TaxID=623280 RepID=A0A1T5CWB7_9SPHI|nr:MULTISPECIES: phosphosulfolactate synthase [Parapedobacter]MBK1440678.1 phosphosulfolactate synthase [Parapedobacter sp. ISTM3]SKB63653.1 phosphosulfolactate synthase [Parapedobacter luteus]